MRKAGLIPAPAPPPSRGRCTIEGPAGRLALLLPARERTSPRGDAPSTAEAGSRLGRMMDVTLEARADALNVAIASVEYRLARASVSGRAERLQAAGAWLAKAKSGLGADLADRRRVRRQPPLGRHAAAHARPPRLPLRRRESRVRRLRSRRAEPLQYDGRNLLLDGEPGVAIRSCAGRVAAAPPGRVAALREPVGAVPRALHRRHARPLRDRTLFLYAGGSPRAAREIQVFPGPLTSTCSRAASAPAHAAIDHFLARCLDAGEGR